MRHIPSKLTLVAGFVLAMVFTFSCSGDNDDGNDQNGGGGSCSINGGTVKIGSQTWMSENLNCNVAGSKCYDNDPANCAKYGRLYDWSTAMALPASCNLSYCASKVSAKHQGICPSGWHIPSDAEWTALMDFVGPGTGTKLKATSGWGNDGNGTDEFGFSALPGGSGGSGGGFTIAGDSGDWWSSTEYDANYAYYRYILYYHEDVYRLDGYKGDLQSVRCLQD